MEYKHNIARLQAVLQSPKDYMMSSVSDAIPTSTAALIYERDKMRKQMGLIVKEIDILSVIILLSHILPVHCNKD